MLKVKNGVVKSTGTKREKLSDLGRLFYHLLTETSISEEVISELLDHAVKEKLIIHGDVNPIVEAEPVEFDPTYGDLFDPTEGDFNV